MKKVTFPSLSVQRREKIQMTGGTITLLKSLENEDLEEIKSFLGTLSFEEVKEIYEIGKSSGALSQYEALKKLQKDKKQGVNA